MLGACGAPRPQHSFSPAHRHPRPGLSTQPTIVLGPVPAPARRPSSPPALQPGHNHTPALQDILLLRPSSHCNATKALCHDRFQPRSYRVWSCGLTIIAGSYPRPYTLYSLQLTSNSLLLFLHISRLFCHCASQIILSLRYRQIILSLRSTDYFVTALHRLFFHCATNRLFCHCASQIILSLRYIENILSLCSQIILSLRFKQIILSLRFTDYFVTALHRLFFHCATNRLFCHCASQIILSLRNRQNIFSLCSQIILSLRYKQIILSLRFTDFFCHCATDRLFCHCATDRLFCHCASQIILSLR